MQIGDIKEFDGVKRKITGFCMVGFDQYPVTEPYLEPADDEELKCQYCGKVCKNALGLASHEEHCKENPKNKGGEE